MQMIFGSIEDATKFYNKLKDNAYKIVVNDENYSVSSATINHCFTGTVTVDLVIYHMPKRAYPKWDMGEEYLKELRQKNTNLKAFTDKVFEVYVGGGHLKEYLKKHNPDGTEK